MVLQKDTLGSLIPQPPGPAPVEPWPAAGHVLFLDVSLRYRADASWAVRGLDLQIAPGQSVGVVGRTGKHPPAIWRHIVHVACWT